MECERLRYFDSLLSVAAEHSWGVAAVVGTALLYQHTELKQCSNAHQPPRFERLWSAAKRRSTCRRGGLIFFFSPRYICLFEQQCKKARASKSVWSRARTDIRSHKKRSLIDPCCGAAASYVHLAVVSEVTRLNTSAAAAPEANNFYFVTFFWIPRSRHILEVLRWDWNENANFKWDASRPWAPQGGAD